MRTKWFVLPAACGLMVTMGSALALADAKVTLGKVHLCCGACIKGVNEAVKDVESAKAVCSRKDGQVFVEAKDEATAQKALDALGAAGYYGESNSKALTIKPQADVPSGKVKSLSVSGVHNCCPSCCRAIKSALKNVSGVTSETAKPKESSFEVTGEFLAADVIKALNEAGFNAKVK
jgi:copper chaperone CopZ